MIPSHTLPSADLSTFAVLADQLTIGPGPECQRCNGPVSSGEQFCRGCACEQCGGPNPLHGRCRMPCA